VKLLRDVGIPCGPVQEISDVIASQYVVDAGMLSTVRAEHEDVRVVNLPLAVPGSGLVDREAGPELGSSTRWAMEATGYSEKEIARYLASVER
jgi:crotonobetainyl-CoA:carnitine CoA-transferase CaiB-like acyl-CoA transferase